MAQLLIQPYLCLASWEWATEPDGESYWRAQRPDLLLGCFDLRSLPQCGSPGPTPQGYGLFVYHTDPGNIGYSLGNWNTTLSLVARRAIGTALGIGRDAITVDNPMAVLLQLLNRYADPTGATRWKPLRVSMRGGLKLAIGGKAYTEPFSALHPAFANTIAVFQADYRRNKADGVPLGVLQKWTGSELLKLYGQITPELAEQILPSEHNKDGAAVPATVYTDDFNGANSDTMGVDLSWTELAGDWDIVSNEAQSITGDAGNLARMNTALSSDDHYAQVDITATIAGSNDKLVGPVIRKDNTATLTFYYGRLNDTLDIVQLYKFIAGVATQLGSNVAVTPSLPDPIKLRATSSDQVILTYDGVDKITASPETSITGNLYTGVRAYGTVSVDNFEAGDIVSGRIMGSLAGRGGLAGIGGLAGRRGGIPG